MTTEILHGTAESVLPTLPDDSFDSLVTDPPAGIGFMGKAWDGDKGGRDAWIAWLAGIMREALRVMKPGAYGLVWALPRTSHWPATALENAGFEICDKHYHLFGTGFPKHKSKLKPACEEWILVRKPAPRATPLQIDACRIAVSSSDTEAARVPQPRLRPEGTDSGHALGTGVGRNGETFDMSKGRWPAHVSLDEEAAAMLDEQAGERRSGAMATGTPRGVNAILGKSGGSQATITDIVASTGGASRFFYVAKPSKRERGTGNDHPTVKSLALMDWLIRLITPPGGTILDPFAGSGTTLLAARAGGWNAVGIEQHEPYAAIARERLARVLL